MKYPWSWVNSLQTNMLKPLHLFIDSNPFHFNAKYFPCRVSQHRGDQAPELGAKYRFSERGETIYIYLYIASTHREISKACLGGGGGAELDEVVSLVSDGGQGGVILGGDLGETRP